MFESGKKKRKGKSEREEKNRGEGYERKERERERERERGSFAIVVCNKADRGSDISLRWYPSVAVYPTRNARTCFPLGCIQAVLIVFFSFFSLSLVFCFVSSPLPQTPARARR